MVVVVIKIPPKLELRMFLIDSYPSGLVSLDSTFRVEPPRVLAQSKDLYTVFIERGINGPTIPSAKSMDMYQKYVSGKLYAVS